MGLFRRKTPSDPLPFEIDEACWLPAESRCEVAGISCRQAAVQAGLQRATRRPPDGLHVVEPDLDALGWTFAALVPWRGRPDAPAGPSAIAVFVPGGRQAGWVPARLSKDFVDMITACAAPGSAQPLGVCPAYFIRWRPDPALIGLRLCVSWPRDVLEDPAAAVSWQAPARLAF